MDKFEFHKLVDGIAEEVGSVRVAFRICNIEAKCFKDENSYRSWKHYNGLKTVIVSNCMKCGVEIKDKSKRRYCGKHRKGRDGPLKRITIRDGVSSNQLYGTWYGIRDRCRNPKSKNYHNYGGRGIKVCDLWYDSFIEFEKWALANGYAKGLQIDRINNNGNYEPLNCRYVEPYINAANRRSANNTSGFIGVSKHTNANSYRAIIEIKGVRTSLGSFKSKNEAAIYRDKYIIENNLPHTKNIL